MNEIEQFEAEVRESVRQLGQSKEIQALGMDFVAKSSPFKYTYNFRWMGRPIIQFPQDMAAMQEILWDVQPDLIIETGIAHGGSLIYYASLLELIGKGKVLGIDIDIREHNRAAIEEHPMAKRIEMIQGSSIDEELAAGVIAQAEEAETVLVVLDSNHTHAHVKAELELYANLVSSGSYCVVFDTIVEDMPPGSYPDRPWDIGDNPKTAVHEFLKSNDHFEIDSAIHEKLLITMAPDGYLKRVR
ncbi:MAG: cephalosporin hydroxylase [Candidatus Paceibacteria bacterium]|jgi:cephalosporin hydroxylase